jgi:hypothetical protein
MRAQRRNTKGEEHFNPWMNVDSGEVTSIVVGASMDWRPRDGLDLDAGMRVGRLPADIDPYPTPHVIGCLDGFMPQIDIWRFGIESKKAEVPTGPYIGETASPGTDGYFPLWYDELQKSY